MKQKKFEVHPQYPATCVNCGCASDKHQGTESDDCPSFKIEMDPIVAMCIIGNIQLATRHPANNGPSKIYAVEFARELQDKLAELMPERAAIVEMGWNPAFDID